jgi:SAM-dependent methyltransferase
MNKNKYIFKINNTSVRLSIGAKVFKPTATTTFLLRDASKLVNKSKDILDLGCGSGVIGVFVNRLNKNKNKIFASDVSVDAVDCARKNFEKYRCNYELKKGSLFSPWKNKKFDLIINDVSGISEKLAKNSSWFKNVPCKTGADGTALTLKIISSSNKYLNKGGGIIFPIISLSNTKKIEYLLKKKFKKIKIMSNNYWFLPNELNKNTNKLIEMKKKNLINFEIKYGKIICNTQIIYAKI